MVTDTLGKYTQTLKDLVDKSDLDAECKDFILDITEKNADKKKLQQYERSCAIWMIKSSDNLPYDELITSIVISRAVRAAKKQSHKDALKQIEKRMVESRKLSNFIIKHNQDMYDEMGLCHGGIKIGERDAKEDHRDTMTRLDHKSWLMLFFTYTESFAQFYHAYLKSSLDQSLKHEHPEPQKKGDTSQERLNFECWAKEYLCNGTREITGYFRHYIDKNEFYDMRSTLMHASLLPKDYFDNRNTYKELQDLFWKTGDGMQTSYNLMGQIHAQFNANILVAIFLKREQSVGTHIDKLDKLLKDLKKSLEGD